MFTEGAKIQYLHSVRYSKHRDKLILLEDFNYRPVTGFFMTETVPKGFITDNASVPDYLAWFIHPNDKRLRQAAWHHDFVPQNKQYYRDKYGYTDDELFLYNNIEMRECCRRHGLPDWKSYAVFYAINNTKQARDIWARGGQINGG